MKRMTTDEVAAKLRCNADTVRRLINAPGGIRASKPAGRWLVSEEDLNAYIESQANHAPARRRRRRAA